jgi:D-alanyl-D-alanine dipeptidase
MTKKEFLKKYQLTEEEVTKLLKNYVAFPSKRRESPSSHYTGGAVDLTLADEKGRLNMGTAFDEFHEKARSDFFEKKENLSDEELVIRDNRRMLKDLMEQSGFLSNPEEWWHFDYGNPRWAKATNRPPIYLGIELKRSNRKGE